MNYIKIDVNGVLKTDKQLLPMTAGDTNSIVILTDYDQEVATPLFVTAYVKRCDGFNYRWSVSCSLEIPQYQKTLQMTT